MAEPARSMTDAGRRRRARPDAAGEGFSGEGDGLARLVRLFISGRRQLLLSLAVFALSLTAALGGLARLAADTVDGMMADVAAKELHEVVRLRDNAFRALEDLARAGGAAAACTPEVEARLRAIAFRPDGLNEFMVLKGNDVLCSTRPSNADLPIRLPQPDLQLSGAVPIAYWFDRSLDLLGLDGHVGTILARGGHAVVLPGVAVGTTLPDWFEVDLHAVAPDGREWHRAGTEGLMETVVGETAGGGLRSLLTRRAVHCDGPIDCIAVQADLGALFAAQPWRPLAGLVLTSLIAWAAASLFHAWLRSYWSFERRFLRHLDAQSIVCHYQPLLRLSDGSISGCEVLARWRDLDDRIVHPDRIIPLVEKAGLTRRFTRLVAGRAFRDLSAEVPPDRRLTVNFNIFPVDLDAEELFRTFEDFLDAPDRFEIVLEIVETERLDLRKAAAEIEKLQRLGFRVYMDDFGTGYFSVESLAGLQLDGVKLDRCFAMAPQGSVMARMLGRVLEMISATGRPVVVEGVECPDILRALREQPRLAAFAQGYGIARPLPPAEFGRFLATFRPDGVADERAA